MKKLIQGGNIHNAIVPEPFVADILIENGKILHSQRYREGLRVFAALDENRKPRPIPPLLPQTEKEIADFAKAKARKAAKKA